MITLCFLLGGAGVRIILRVYRVSVEMCLDLEIGTERGEHINVSACLDSFHTANGKGSDLADITTITVHNLRVL